MALDTNSKFLVAAGILLLVGSDCLQKELGPLKRELARYTWVRKLILLAAIYTVTQNIWISLGIVLVVGALYT
tara:strand:- start:301 stop:519 length:219 start_codon:yes stop_codon:yes gene_type:complete